MHTFAFVPLRHFPVVQIPVLQIQLSVADPHELVENLVGNLGFRPGFRLDSVMEFGPYITGRVGPDPEKTDPWSTIRPLTTHHFSGPGRTICLVCVPVCVAITFEL